MALVVLGLLLIGFGMVSMVLRCCRIAFGRSGMVASGMRSVGPEGLVRAGHTGGVVVGRGCRSALGAREAGPGRVEDGESAVLFVVCGGQTVPGQSA